MIDSKLDKWCDQLDRKYNLYEDNVYQKVEIDITPLWLEEISYRKKYYLNILMSITGQQGRAFKSLFGLTNAFTISDIYGVPFDIANNTLIDPFDIEEALKKAKRKTTFLVDEYQHKRVDVGSASQYFSLIDYEEQGRITQKNIILATPNIFDERHYFIFREHSHTRIKNPRCAKCTKNDKCHEDHLNTLCSIPFHKREGYPLEMCFMLWTHRKMDNQLMPRGLVKMQIPTHQTLIEYDKIKAKNIRRLEKDESSGWGRFMNEATAIYNKDPNSFTKELANGRIVAESTSFIEYKIRETIGLGKYPKQLISFMAMKIKELVNK